MLLMEIRGRMSNRHTAGLQWVKQRPELLLAQWPPTGHPLRGLSAGADTYCVDGMDLVQMAYSVASHKPFYLVVTVMWLRVDML